MSTRAIVEGEGNLTPPVTILAAQTTPLTPLAPAVSPVRLIKKHPLAIRWFHWINFPILFLMIWSGILILWANDVYPTEKYALKVPNRISIYQWGIAPVYAGKGDDYPVPAAKRYDINTGFRLSEGMAWHFNLAWIFALNGILYTAYLIYSGQWRFLAPQKNSFVEAFKVVLYDVGLWKRPLPPGKYNHAQRIAYSAVIVMAIVMVITGLAIYKPAQLAWLTIPFGGYQGARTVHFIVTCLLVAFFFVHVAQVARTGWNNFRGMITGKEIVRETGGHA